MLVFVDNKIHCFLLIIERLKAILEKKGQETEIFKLIQEIEKKLSQANNHPDSEKDNDKDRG